MSIVIFDIIKEYVGESLFNIGADGRLIYLPFFDLVDEVMANHLLEISLTLSQGHSGVSEVGVVLTEEIEAEVVAGSRLNMITRGILVAVKSTNQSAHRKTANHRGGHKTLEISTSQ